MPNYKNELDYQEARYEWEEACTVLTSHSSVLDLSGVSPVTDAIIRDNTIPDISSTGSYPDKDADARRASNILAVRGPPVATPSRPSSSKRPQRVKCSPPPPPSHNRQSEVNRQPSQMMAPSSTPLASSSQRRMTPPLSPRSSQRRSRPCVDEDVYSGSDAEIEPPLKRRRLFATNNSPLARSSSTGRSHAPVSLLTVAEAKLQPGYMASAFTFVSFFFQVVQDRLLVGLLLRSLSPVSQNARGVSWTHWTQMCSLLLG